MNFHLPALRWSLLPAKIRGMFNLNDPRWGRDDDKSNADSGNKPAGDVPPPPGPKPDAWQQPPGRGSQPQSGPPDLDELWRDFNRKLGQLFGGSGGPQKPQGPGGSGGSGGPGIPVFFKNLGLGVILAAALLVWLGTGFFIVQEGQQAVITQFGKYHSTVGAGFNWRMPYPIQRQELVFVTQIRSVDIGRDTIIKATGLRESAMLTEDENIVEIKFAVQYRLNDARAYLFESRNPTEAVVQSAETAVREVVGKMKMDSALAEERDQIAPRVREKMQTILDRYKVGIEVVGINLQQGGVRPPEQVQAAFDDVLKAGQERERAKNEAQAYANDVVPRAVGAASRLKEEADAYRERIVAQAEGDAQRFKTILPEYQKSPQVMRDRMYTDTMQQIYSNVTKVLVDSKQGSNLLYLPLDKIMQQVTATAPPAADVPTAPTTGVGVNNGAVDTRSRDLQRSRDRDPR
ncbi:FtsH protease activity modulator HflK [Limnohabitans sp. G3-2]|uniref:FtsH protease activity modulator HflK n=1 Tax=Limnohabitans sp. G3-2 TaxID=1100711 RepID=UPI000C1F6113|nr:FtsH protease activity modulator HflK [Limnohabitans sp. G3-2]PIT71795.1 HflK protein [Limnohabitans sp. G3-2]